MANFCFKSTSKLTNTDLLIFFMYIDGEDKSTFLFNENQSVVLVGSHKLF